MTVMHLFRNFPHFTLISLKFFDKPDLEMFIDGAYQRTEQGSCRAQYVIATHLDLLKYYPFPGAKSVQVAEIVALTTDF